MSNAEVIPIGRGARTGERCKATTSTGRPCRNYAADDSGYCRVHGGEERELHPAGSLRGGSEERAALPESNGGRLEGFLRRRFAGDYPIDDFGLDEELLREVMIPLLRPLYQHYFRVRSVGVERIPESGPALLVGNHAGAIALDAIIVQHAVATEHPANRIVRNIGEDLVFRLPFIGPLARKCGAAVAREEDGSQLLERGELVGVYPEGFKGVGTGWGERNRLHRFGRGGFVRLALRARAPIVPVAIVGAERAYPIVANVKPLANMLRLPYFPVTPTFPLLGPLGALPLPSRWTLEFGEPMGFDEYPADSARDPTLVLELAARVRERIAGMLEANLDERRRAFL